MGKYLVVGAGFAGSVVARELADRGKQVIVIDKRRHIGGNAYDKMDTYSNLIHPYGPHIFHTNSERIFRYLSRFTDWRFYEHRVRAVVEGYEFPMPINLDTIEKFFNTGRFNTEEDAQRFLAEKRTKLDYIHTSAEVALSTVGPELTQAFFDGYTRKQWGRSLAELDKTVLSRIPLRFNRDDRYFTDKFQFMPSRGYTNLFWNLLDHPNIEIKLGVVFRPVPCIVKMYEHIVYTGPVDEYFGWRFGKLPWRSLRFEHTHKDVQQYQSVAVLNYPDIKVPWTRVTEFNHMTGQEGSGTSLCTEFPAAEGDPYYPVPSDESKELYRKYQELVNAETNVTFVGRLAQYRYYNMDQAVGAALEAASRVN